jgi:hypothetical protein
MKKFVWLFLAMSLALIPVGSVFAQDAPPVFCGDLADEDCILLEDAAALDSEVTSGAYDFVVDVEVVGIPGMPVEEIAFSWVQESIYALDPNLEEDMMAYLEGLDADSMADIDVLSDVLTMAIDGADTEQAFEITIGADTASLLSSEMGMPIPTEIGLHYALVDGIIYVNISELAAYVPELAGLPIQGWVGTELAPLLDVALAQMAADPNAMASMAPFTAALAGGAAGSSMTSEQLAFFEPFVDVQRLRDDAIDGEPIAVYSTVFDFIDFASSDEFVDYVAAQAAMAEQMGMEAISEDDLAEMEEMMPMVAPMLFGGLDYEVQQAISLDSGYTIATAAAMNWDLASLLAMAESDGESAMSDSEAVLYFGMETNKYGQNEVDEVPAPQGAFVLPAEMLMSMIGG